MGWCVQARTLRFWGRVDILVAKTKLLLVFFMFFLPMLGLNILQTYSLGDEYKAFYNTLLNDERMSKADFNFYEKMQPFRAAYTWSIIGLTLLACYLLNRLPKVSDIAIVSLIAYFASIIANGFVLFGNALIELDILKAFVVAVVVTLIHRLYAWRFKK